MPAPNAYLSLHDVHAVSAYAEISLGNPLMLAIEGAHGKLRVAVFFSDTGDNYAKRLADAINDVPLRLPQPPDDAHAAAHDAVNVIYGSRP